MRRWLTLLSSVALVLTMALPAGGAERIQPDRPVPVPDVPTEWVNESPQAWFVELASPPTINGSSRAQLAAERTAFRRAAAAVGIEYSERMTFEALFNGFSLSMDAGQLGRLGQLPEVKAVYPVMSIPMPATAISGPDLATAIQMTGADVAQSELGLSGAGIRVGVMDTGIDYDHPDLGGCFGVGCRVETGWDFVGDDFNADDTASSYNPIPVPDPDPDDCQGHGTHVSGIVGANGAAVGVAPGVTFGAYRVFGCEGSTTADIMIAAMERALADDMDVLNMSIGSPFTWPQYPTAVASNYLVDAGMVVVASIGNSGASGTYSAGAPGLGEKVIGVAAFENVTATFPVFEVVGTGAGASDIGFNPMSFSADAPASGAEGIVFVGRGCTVEDSESGVPAGGDPYLDDPSGKIALIERGACSFAEKAAGAFAAGATKVVVHNNLAGNFNGTLGEPPAEDWVVVSVSLADGLHIRGLVDPIVTWTDRVAAFPNPAAGLIASFSSYGLAPDLTLKPDIGAPGGNIYSTYPLEQGGYANLGGTSMASPHVAGAAALLLEARPGTPAEMVRDIFQNSADPGVWSLNPGIPVYEPVHRQGAGMVDIDDAILATTMVRPGKLSLGESEAAPHSATLTIANYGDATVTYELGMEESGFGCCSAALATTGTFAEDLGFWLTWETVMFDSPTVTLGPGESTDVEVTVYPDIPEFIGADNVQYGGYITVDGGSELYRVPYAGFVGDYQSIEVLGASVFGVFPALGVTDDGENFGLVPPGWTYSMEGYDVPNILLHLQHQSRLLVGEVRDASTGQVVHPIFNSGFEEEYLPRNSTSGGFFAFPWDGTRLHSNGKAKLKVKDVPDGDYYIVVRVLKALGSVDNPDHWETWTSDVFEIDRPNVRPGKKPKMN
ncbi:MAG: S8 family serine peptidase [Acidimicrobiia bacterium]